MAVTEIAMPALSSTMTSGRVVSWLVGKGDMVEAGDPVMVVESDKADMEVSTAGLRSELVDLRAQLKAEKTLSLIHI